MGRIENDGSQNRRAGARRRHAQQLAWLMGGLLVGCVTGRPPQGAEDVEPTPIYRFEGDVMLRNGTPLHYRAIILPDPAGPGRYLGTIDIPRQALSGAALRAVELEPGERVEFALEGAGEPRWIGAYDTDGALGCEFSQGGESLPCSMREVKEIPVAAPEPPHRPQTPLPPYPYASEDVRYVNAEQHVMLEGTLTVPAGAGPHPALIVVGDHDAPDRDGSLAGHRPWLLLADHLTREGIAVLRAEPRASASRDVTAPPPSAEGREGDVRAALSFLRGRKDIDAARLGVIGHGRGGLIAARLSREPGVELLVLLGTPALPGRQVLARQSELEALEAGASPPSAAQARQDVEGAVAIIESERDPVRVRQWLTTLYEKVAARGPAIPGAWPLSRLLGLAEAPSVSELTSPDPAPLLRGVDDAVLAVVPELDREVDPSENLPALRAALADNPRALVQVVPGQNHRLQTAESGVPSEYERLSETIAPSTLALVSSWVRQSSRRP